MTTKVENYKIIQDKDLLINFIDNFLPELERDETYYVCLFARNKYEDPNDKKIVHINSDKAQLKRFTSDKQKLFDKIQQLECPLGSYKQHDIEIDNSILALYITPNPRSMLNATKTSLHRVVELITSDAHNYNLHQEIMSEIQKAKSRTCFVDFDFDVDKSKLNEIEDLLCNDKFINQEAFHILETRGGYHVLVKPESVRKEFTNKWYQGMIEVLKLYSTDTHNKGDMMIPVPGCIQGNFIPRFI